MDKYGAGAGLQGRLFPAVDVDVLDAGMSAQVTLLASAMLGAAPERVGRAPKALLPYRLEAGAEPISKRRVEFFLPGDETKHAVEILGRGQQYVVEGLHPGTGKPYAWTGGTPAQLGAANLAPVTADKVDRFLDEVAKAVEAAGGVIHARGQHSDDANLNVNQGGLVGDAATIRDALNAMGNQIQDYSEWITMCAAIKAALGGDEGHYPIFEAWNLAHPGNSSEEVRAKWDSLAPPYRVGADYVYRKAADAGWTGYAQAAFGGANALPPASSTVAGVPLDLTEDGIALRFADEHADRLRYDVETGAWFCWSGDRWTHDRTYRAFSWTREMLRQHAQGQPQQRAFNLRSVKTAGAVEKFARSDPRLVTTADRWDADPWMLGYPGGVIDLRTGQRSTPRPDQLITKQVAAAPDDPTHYSCPTWLRFLCDATNGDLALVAFLQQIAGYCLTGDTTAHAMFFIFGDGGTGKSTFVQTLQKAMGSYACSAPMDTFTAAKFDGHSTDLAMLAGARLVTASETERGRKWAEGRIKSITGGDPITARFMRQNNFTFTPQLKLLMTGNHAPSLTSVDASMRRRLHVIPFEHKPARKDPALPEKLERELAGILGWALAGLMAFQGGGAVFVAPATVAAATNSYFDDQDVFGRWITDQLVVGAGLAAASVELFSAWSSYARSHGAEAGTQADFKASMERRGFKSGSPRIQGRQVRGYKGVGLKAQVGGTQHPFEVLAAP